MRKLNICWTRMGTIRRIQKWRKHWWWNVSKFKYWVTVESCFTWCGRWEYI